MRQYTIERRTGAIKFKQKKVGGAERSEIRPVVLTRAQVGKSGIAGTQAHASARMEPRRAGVKVYGELFPLLGSCLSSQQSIQWWAWGCLAVCWPEQSAGRKDQERSGTSVSFCHTTSNHSNLQRAMAASSLLFSKSLPYFSFGQIYSRFVLQSFRKFLGLHFHQWSLDGSKGHWSD